MAIVVRYDAAGLARCHRVTVRRAVVRRFTSRPLKMPTQLFGAEILTS
jgi:hypothetical protein